MNSMKRGLVLAAACVLQVVSFSFQGFAADLIEEPVQSGGGYSGGLKDEALVLPPVWSGLYFGGFAGGVWTGKTLSDNFTYEGDPSFNGKLGGSGLPVAVRSVIMCNGGRPSLG